MKMDNSKDRRKFLKLLLTGGALAVSTPVIASQEVSDPKDKIKMLTEDGTLVEIDRELFDQIKTGKKAANQDIRTFVKPAKKGNDER
jgi:hypothetical protein